MYSAGYDGIDNKLEDIIKRDINKLNSLSKAYADYENELQSLNMVIGIAEQRQKTILELRSAEELNAEKQPMLESLKKSLDDASEKIKDCENIDFESNNIILALNRFDKAEAMEKSNKLIESKISELSDKKTRGEAKIKQLEIGLSMSKERLGNISNSGEAIKEFEFRLRELKAREAEGRRFERLFGEFKNAESDYIIARKQYIEAYHKSHEADSECLSKEKMFLDEQAGILAESLDEGKECPVCGSTVHPKKAKKSINAPTQAEIEKLKKENELLKNSASEKSAEAGRKKGAFTSLEKEIKKGSFILSEAFEIDDIPKLLADEFKSISKYEKSYAEYLNKARTEFEEKEKIERTIPDIEKRIEDGKNFITGILNEITGLQSEFKSNKNHIDETLSEIGFNNKSEAQERLNELKIKKEKIEREFEEAKTAYEGLDRVLLENSARIKALNEQISGLAETDMKDIYKKRDDISGLKDSVMEQIKITQTGITNNKKALENISPKLKRMKLIENRIAVLKPLSDTANGNIAGKERITLEAYIQTAYFEMILSRANTRFMIMTNGQYEMVRRKEAYNLKSQSGLEIDIIDHYNSSVRSIKTLSGGESFKAALALALGLSEQVQSSCGGIKLDTIFIDEGFGSLDSESLEQAVRALVRATEGEKVVGIISHVSELKERIDRQIVVRRKKSGGSSIEIVV